MGSKPLYELYLLCLQYVSVLSAPRPLGADIERNCYDSLIIVLDTLEQCLSYLPKDTARFDEAMNVKLLLRELCQFIGKVLISIIFLISWTFMLIGSCLRLKSWGYKKLGRVNSILRLFSVNWFCFIFLSHSFRLPFPSAPTKTHAISTMLKRFPFFLQTRMIVWMPYN